MSEANANSPVADLVLRNIIDKSGRSVPVSEIAIAIRPATFGAIGNGSSDDTQAFAALESEVSGKIIDLSGQIFAVSSIPNGNYYVNATWVIDGEEIKRDYLPGLISSDENTGQYGSAYGGGNNDTPTTPGNTTPFLYALLASQGCLSEGPARAVNVGSIYSHAKGNVSGNYTSRQSLAWVPQSVNLASEECVVWGGFRGLNAASIYSFCENESNANVAARSCHASGRNSVNVGSTDCYAGRGGGAWLKATSAGGTVTSVEIIRGGLDYQPGDAIEFHDRLELGLGAAASVSSVDSSGVITGVSLTAGGSGYSDTVDAKVDNGTGDFSGNFASIDRSKTFGTASANMATETCIASGHQSANIASANSTAAGLLSLVLSGNNSKASADGSVAIGRRVDNQELRSIAFGDASSGSPSSANRKFHMHSNGNLDIAGALAQNQTFTDVAKMFENVEPTAIPVGSLVAWEGRKVRLAEPGDVEISVHSRTYAMLLGDTAFTWASRYQRDEFGEQIIGDVWDEDEQGYVKGPLENPDYDPSLEQTPRSQRRDEWTPVCLLGEAHVRVESSVGVDDYIAPGVNGVGSRSDEQTRMRCMQIMQPFDKEKGYAVALCLKI